MLYSDRIKRKFPTYVLNQALKILPGVDTPTINFEALVELMLSRDLSRVEELQKLGEGDPKFLDSKCSMVGNRIALSSFPRTGNSFLRRFIEQCTGLYTGCDMFLHITMPE
jgi:hypothetical protein